LILEKQRPHRPNYDYIEFPVLEFRIRLHPADIVYLKVAEGIKKLTGKDRGGAIKICH
jgi:hypothetical protein